MENNIEKSLVLSTAHLKEETMESISTYKDFPLRVQEHDHGLIVFLNLAKSDYEYELEDNWYLTNDMEEFLHIVRVARQYECSTINFDSAASESSQFETFEW